MMIIMMIMIMRMIMRMIMLVPSGVGYMRYGDQTDAADRFGWPRPVGLAVCLSKPSDWLTASLAD